MRLDELRAGLVVLVDREASVQFAPDRVIAFRLIGWKKADYDGWIWVSGYQLNASGDATERRDLFLQYEGLRPAEPARPAPGQAAHRRPAAPAPRSTGTPAVAARRPARRPARPPASGVSCPESVARDRTPAS